MFSLRLSVSLRLRWNIFYKRSFNSFFLLWISLPSKRIRWSFPFRLKVIFLRTKIFLSFIILRFSKRWQSRLFLNFRFFLDNINNIFTFIFQWKFLNSSIQIWRIISICIKSRWWWLSCWSVLMIFISLVFLDLIQLCF